MSPTKTFRVALAACPPVCLCSVDTKTTGGQAASATPSRSFTCRVGWIDAVLLAANAEIGAAADRVSDRGRRGVARFHRVESGRKRGIVYGRNGPHGARTLLRPFWPALGQTGIICCGAMDLSVGSILAVAGTVFGMLHARGVGPSGCFAACFFTAFGLSAYNGLLDSRAADPGDHRHAGRAGVLPRLGADPGRSGLARIRRAIHA